MGVILLYNAKTFKIFPKWYKNSQKEGKICEFQADRSVPIGLPLIYVLKR